MSEAFLKVVNMSISAGWLVLAVLALRLILKKAPKWVNVLLWGIVAVRLICPFSIESALSLIPSTETISPDIMMDWTPEISTGIEPLDQVVNPVISTSFAPQGMASANPLQILIPVAANLWLLGVLILLVYTAISYLTLRYKLRTAVILRDNIFQCETVSSPFVLGILKPRIYLPYAMDGKNLAHVVAHEQAHIKRKDHWWKPLGFLLLTVYWFNPLMWVAYILLCRDIELACDEKVIEELGNEQRADYTQALVACAVNRRMIAACPLAFGEVGVKDRIKSIMNYRKPAFWIIVTALLVCLVVAVCFLTDPNPSREFSMSGNNVSSLDPEAIVERILDIEDWESSNVYMNSVNFSLHVDSNFNWMDSQTVSYFFSNAQKTYGAQLRIFPEEGKYFLTEPTEKQEQNRIFLLQHYLEALKYLPQYEIMQVAPADQYIISHIDGGSPSDYQRVITYSSQGVSDIDGWNIHLQVQPLHADGEAYSGTGEEVIELFYSGSPRSVTENIGSILINQPYGVVQVTYESPHFNFSMVAQENTPEYFIDENLHLYSVKEHSEYPDWTDLGELTEISLTKDNFDKLFTSNSGDGWSIRESASEIRKSTEKAWTVIYDQDKLYYVLQQKNGELYLAYGYYDYSEKDDPGSDDTSIRWLYLLAKHTTNRNIGYSALYSEAMIAEAFNVIEKEFGQRFSGSTLLELRYDDAIENRFADIIMNWDLDKGQELITVLTTFEKDGQKESCVWYLVRTEDKKSWEYVSWEFFSKKLSLNDIIILSQKGYDLSWADFEQYEYIETGFGLYIRRYEINDLFHFSIGGAGPNSEPMYMYLGVNGDDPEARIDIREGGVTEFIEAHRNDTPASSSVAMVPTDTKMYGLQVGALLLPIDGDTYRYLLTDNTGEGVTADELIFEFTEPDLNRTINWEVYSLKEYPDLSVVMILSKEEGPWLCTYSPPGRCSDTALTDAINAGYVVMEDGVATHGQDIWKSFYEDAQKGEAGSVIVAHYQTLDPERCDTAYFEAFNQDYPSLNLYHLTFDGTSYTLSFTDSGVEYIRNYEYLMKLEASGTPLVGNTEHKRIVHYALTHDTEHTWEELWGSLASSAFPAPIDFYTIYSENVK